MLHRRDVLAMAASAAAVAALPVHKLSAAPKGPARVRFNATSPEGRAMLDVYAKGVCILKGRSAKDPASWMFQWFTHFTPGPLSPQGKAKQIELVFGSTPSPGRTAAELMWSTCQAHLSPPELEQNFLAKGKLDGAVQKLMNF